MADDAKANSAEEGKNGVPTRCGTWLDERRHPPIRKRWWCLEVEMQDSGGAWTYVEWRRHQSWRRYLLQPRPLLRSVWMELPLLILVALATVFAGLY